QRGRCGGGGVEAEDGRAQRAEPPARDHQVGAHAHRRVDRQVHHLVGRQPDREQQHGEREHAEEPHGRGHPGTPGPAGTRRPHPDPPPTGGCSRQDGPHPGPPPTGGGRLSNNPVRESLVESPFGMRWTTLATGVLILLVIGVIRRRPDLAVISAVAWAGGFEATYGIIDTVYWHP